jgi:hypothetical protein
MALILEHQINQIMKTTWLFLLIIISIYTVTQAQTPLRTITFHMDENASSYFSNKYKDTAVNAYKIVSAVFSSKEFQDQVAALSFKCESYEPGCNKIPLTNGRISGQTLLDMLFKVKAVTDTLHLKKGGGALGETKPFRNITYTHFKPLRKDMPELPFTYSLAVNICHEYMHSLGFVHLYCNPPTETCPGLNEQDQQPDPQFYNDDVTYRIGWIAYYILKDKYEHNQGF